MEKSKCLKLSMLLVLFVFSVLLWLFIAPGYPQRSYSLGLYSPKDVQCSIVYVPEVKGKILYEKHTQNYSVMLTEAGVYRKLLSDTKWYSLSCPPSIDFGYYFQTTTYSDNLVSFPGYGLYLSKDAGLTWFVLYDEIRFNAAFFNKDDLLYVVAAPPTNFLDVRELYRYLSGLYYGIPHYDRDRVLVSEDHGKTWKDITGNIAPGVRLNRIYEDPYNVSSICLEGWTVRQYAFQVERSSFGGYQWTRMAHGDCRKPNTLVAP